MSKLRIVLIMKESTFFTKNSIVTILLSFFFISCSTDKDSNSDINLSNSNNATNSQTICTENTENTYEFVGRLHNLILIEFLEEYPNAENMTNDEVMDVIEGILLNNDEFVSMLESDEYFRMTQQEIEGIIMDYPNDFENVIEGLGLSIELEERLTEFISVTINFTSEYSDYIDFVLDYEEALLAETLPNEEEKEFILAITSIARHSACLWNEIYEEEKGKGGTWLVIGADVLGGIIGGAAASPGFWTVAAGALSGASGASAIASRL